MPKRIVVLNKWSKQLQEEFRCTRQSVSRALNYHNDSPLSQNIRKEAIKMGGKIVELNETESNGGESDQ